MLASAQLQSPIRIGPPLSQNELPLVHADQQAAEAVGRGLQSRGRLQLDTRRSRIARGRSLAAIR